MEKFNILKTYKNEKCKAYSESCKISKMELFRKSLTALYCLFFFAQKALSKIFGRVMSAFLEQMIKIYWPVSLLQYVTS